MPKVPVLPNLEKEARHYNALGNNFTVSCGNCAATDFGEQDTIFICCAEVMSFNYKCYIVVARYIQTNLSFVTLRSVFQKLFTLLHTEQEYQYSERQINKGK